MKSTEDDHLFAWDNNTSLANVLSVLPKRICSAIEQIPELRLAEEIRLRVARPVQLITSNGEILSDSAVFTAADARELLDRICAHSVYAHTEQLRNGYVTLKGGSRAGICGKPTVENGHITNIVDIYSFNLRIAREVAGCAKSVMRFLLCDGKPVSSLIAAPPGGGKTTLLRDVARCFSDGDECPPFKVAIADERGELAACVNGVPGFDIGRRTDVMDSAPKAQSISLLIRSMSPQVIVTDEIGGEGDSEAIAEAVRCGVAVIASAHGSGLDQLNSRRCTRELVHGGVFKRLLCVDRKGSMLHISSIQL